MFGIEEEKGLTNMPTVQEQALEWIHQALRSKLLTFYRPKVDEPQTDRMIVDTLGDIHLLPLQMQPKERKLS